MSMVDATTNLIAIGEIIKAQGIKGEVKTVPLTDDLRRFGQIKRVFLQSASAGLLELWIESYRLFKEFVLLKFVGIDDMTAATNLGRGLLLIPRNERPGLPKGRFYLDEIIGLDVYTETTEYLGRIDEVLQTGANDVYSVRRESRQILIPALKSVIRQVDLTAGRMTVILPEGLREDSK
jgi:16S rRNA processing protein RimM